MLASTQLHTAGTPDPLDFRRARPVGGFFAQGAILSDTVATVVLVPIAGALALRLRGKISTTEAVPPNPIGTLSFAYRRPPPNEATAYSTALDAASADQLVTKDAEFMVNVAPVGESLLAITYTPAGGIDPAAVVTITFLDQMQQ